MTGCAVESRCQSIQVRAATVSCWDGKESPFFDPALKGLINFVGLFLPGSAVMAAGSTRSARARCFLLHSVHSLVC